MILDNPDRSARINIVGDRLDVAGILRIDTVETLDRAAVIEKAQGISAIDISGLTHLDTAGAWVLVDLQERVSATSGSVTLDGANEAQAQLIEVVRQSRAPAPAGKKKHKELLDQIEQFGRMVVESSQKALDLVSFLGQVVATLAGIMIRPKRLRLTSLVHHCQEVGLNAVPIVALMAFLIGIVLAFQGAAQLRQFGAEVFVVDLIAISVLRELGILLTAIIVAGRSGSAFAAAIGTMKMREEIDAMRTIGLDPFAVLIVPRVLALMLMLPALGFIADLSGLLGGAMMSWIELGVSPAVFQSRLVSNTDVWHFAIGMIKAPFFAAIIGVVGCYEGMKVGGDAESLGRRTSTSVVLSIFLVIVMDALFSIFFAIVGV